MQEALQLTKNEASDQPSNYNLQISIAIQESNSDLRTLQCEDRLLLWELKGDGKVYLQQCSITMCSLSLVNELVHNYRLR